MMIAESTKLTIDLATIGAAVAGLGLMFWRTLRYNSGGDPGGRRECQSLRTIEVKVDELLDMHRKTDSEGRPTWWFPQGMIARLEKAIEAIRKNSETQERLTDAVKRLCDHVARNNRGGSK